MGSASPVRLSGRLAGMSLPKQVAVLAVWPFIQQFLLWLAGAVDTWIAGTLPDPVTGEVSDGATAALGVAHKAAWFLSLIVMGMAAGSSALVARATGGGHRGLARAALGQGIGLGVATGLALGVFVYFGAPWITGLSGLEGEAAGMCMDFLRVCAFAMPLVGFLFAGAMALMSAGDPKPTFYAMLAMNGVNLAAALMLALPSGHALKFGLVLPWGLGLGVPGIAYGWGLGWLAGAAVVFLRLWAVRGDRLRLLWHRLVPHPHTLRRIWGVSWPAVLERIGQGGGHWVMIVIVGAVARRGGAGAHPQATYFVADKIEAMSYLPALAFSIAAATLMGQYLGAGDPAGAKRAGRACWLSGAVLMSAFGLLFILFPEMFVNAFTDQVEIRRDAPELVRVAGYWQFLFGAANILQGGLRGAGDTRATALIFNGLAWGLRLPLAALLGLGFGWGLFGVWWAIGIEISVRGLLYLWRFESGKWMKVKV